MGRRAGAGHGLVRRLVCGSVPVLTRWLGRRTVTRSQLRRATCDAAGRGGRAGTAVAVLAWLTVKVSPAAALAAIGLWVVGPLLRDAGCTAAWRWLRSRQIAAALADRRPSATSGTSATSASAEVGSPQIRRAGGLQAGGDR